jgi:hypothetical protein
MKADEQQERPGSGRVVGLFTAAKAGAPMESRDTVVVEAGVGIVGDRYASGLGQWSDPRWPDQELTMVEAEAAETLAIDAALLRRNVVVRGIALDALIGATFQVGEVVLQGMRRCDPCGYLESLTQPGLTGALADRGGLRTKVLRSGQIQVGDEVTLIEAPERNSS